MKLAGYMALAALVAAGAASTAEARPGMGGMHGWHLGGMSFAELDADGDGQITAEEYAAARAAQLEGLDANGDGLISAEEIADYQLRLAEAAIRARAERLVEMLDVNGDGLLDAAELAASPRPVVMLRLPAFERLDADGDGVVTEAEFEAAQQRRGAGRGEGRAPHGRAMQRPAPDAN